MIIILGFTPFRLHIPYRGSKKAARQHHKPRAHELNMECMQHAANPPAPFHVSGQRQQVVASQASICISRIVFSSAIFLNSRAHTVACKTRGRTSLLPAITAFISASRLLGTLSRLQLLFDLTSISTAPPLHQGSWCSPRHPGTNGTDSPQQQCHRTQKTSRSTLARYYFAGGSE